MDEILLPGFGGTTSDAAHFFFNIPGGGCGLWALDHPGRQPPLAALPGAIDI